MLVQARESAEGEVLDGRAGQAARLLQDGGRSRRGGTRDGRVRDDDAVDSRSLGRVRNVGQLLVVEVGRDFDEHGRLDRRREEVPRLDDPL